jgi:L-rhamnose-H+ transport protein
MNESLAVGIALTMVAGLMSGTCMLPMKFVRSWKWENVWLVFSVVSLIVIPWALALGLVSNLFETYGALSLRQLGAPVLFGAGWGIAQVLFGISVARLGLGLAYAIIVGLGALLGTLVPLFVQHQELAKGRPMMFVLSGVTVMVLGIILSTWGGQVREAGTSATSTPQPSQNYFTAVLLALLCGIMAPMLNYSFAFGQDIAKEAVRLGTPEVRSGYAVWPIGLAGGFIPNIAYSVYLLFKNCTWGAFRLDGKDFGWSTLMGVLWMGAFSLYGMAAIYLGSFGTSIGWGLLQIFMIMTATLSGVLAGEWKHAAGSAKQLLGAGLACLILATVLLALGTLTARRVSRQREIFRTSLYEGIASATPRSPRK